MQHKTLYVLSLLAVLLAPTYGSAQSRQRFSVASFHEVPTDMTATHSEVAEKDGSGYYYAIIKLTSTNPDDNLLDYDLDFGLINAKDVPGHSNEYERWIYVQQNAKTVNISRDGYVPVRNYDLRHTLRAGSTYEMQLSSSAKPVYKQIVLFKVNPPESQAFIQYRLEEPGSAECILGQVSSEGELSKSLPYGRYIYRITTPDALYRESNGVITLNNKDSVLVEEVNLKPEFDVISLNVDHDAKIYINGELIGKGSWIGKLPYDTYNIVCRAEHYRNSEQYITIEAGGPNEFTLNSPEPILGGLTIVSNPGKATVTVDGEEVGETPKSLNLLEGKHHVEVSKEEYHTQQYDVDIKDGGMADLEVTLIPRVVYTINSKPAGATLFINGESVGVTPYSAEIPAGDYRLRLEKNRYHTKNYTAHLDPNNRMVTVPMMYKYFKNKGFTMHAGYMVGTLMAPTLSIGCYLGGFNMEAFATLVTKEATFYLLNNYGNEISYEEERLKPLIFGGRIGYGIKAMERLRITPQIGAMSVAANGIDIDISCISALAGVKCEFALTKVLSVVLAPQYRFAVSQGDAFKEVADLDSGVKGWGNGFDCTIGLSINF